MTLGILILTGVMTLPLMFGFALALGVVTAFDNPARQAFVSDLVAQENASNAVALNAASFNTARLIGPAVAGVMIVAVGTGWVFLVNAVTFSAMIAALLLMRPHELVVHHRRGGPARLADGFRYVARRPDLVVIFVMVFLLGAFGMNFPIFASTMALEFGRGADGFGLLSSFVAIGPSPERCSPRGAIAPGCAWSSWERAPSPWHPPCRCSPPATPRMRRPSC